MSSQDAASNNQKEETPASTADVNKAQRPLNKDVNVIYAANEKKKQTTKLPSLSQQARKRDSSSNHATAVSAPNSRMST